MPPMCSRCHRVPAAGYCSACQRQYMIERGLYKPHQLVRCESCDVAFVASARRRRYCSADCRAGWYRPQVLQPCGTDGAYQRGCRCIPCKVANAASKGRQLKLCPVCGLVTRARDGGPCMECRPDPPESVLASGTCPECGGVKSGRTPRCRECARERQRENQRRARRKWNHARRAKARGVEVEKISEQEIFERDGWRCHLCGKRVRKVPQSQMDPQRASIDHIWPLSKGGEHVRENVACAHLSCNLRKHARVEFAQPLLVG